MVSKPSRRQCKGTTRKSWLGAALVVVLLLAETLAVTHPLDAAAHTDGQPCSVCLSTATLGAGAVATPPVLELDAATPVLTARTAPASVSIAPIRRFARGPPGTFTS